METVNMAAEVYHQLQIQKEDIFEQPVSQVEKERRVISAANEALNLINEKIRQEGFADKAEEIMLFKTALPPIYAIRIYFTELFHIENRKPVGAKKSLKKYFKTHVKKVEEYFTNNLSFYTYWRMNEERMDEVYFIRNNTASQNEMELFAPFIDHSVSTVHCVKTAFIIAYEWLTDYLTRALDNLKKNNDAGAGGYKLTWTDTTIGLTELIYAFWQKGCFGKATLKQIVKFFEVNCDAKLGNYSRTIQATKHRKRSSGTFPDKLNRSLEALEEKWEEDADEE